MVRIYNITTTGHLLNKVLLKGTLNFGLRAKFTELGLRTLNFPIPDSGVVTSYLLVPENVSLEGTELLADCLILRSLPFVLTRANVQDFAGSVPIKYKTCVCSMEVTGKGEEDFIDITCKIMKSSRTFFTLHINPVFSTATCKVIKSSLDSYFSSKSIDKMELRDETSEIYLHWDPFQTETVNKNLLFAVLDKCLNLVEKK